MVAAAWTLLLVRESSSSSNHSAAQGERPAGGAGEGCAGAPQQLLRVGAWRVQEGEGEEEEQGQLGCEEECWTGAAAACGRCGLWGRGQVQWGSGVGCWRRRWRMAAAWGRSGGRGRVGSREWGSYPLRLNRKREMRVA